MHRFGTPTLELLPGKHKISYGGRIKSAGLLSGYAELDLQAGHSYEVRARRPLFGTARGAIYIADEKTGEVLHCVSYNLYCSDLGADGFL